MTRRVLLSAVLLAAVLLTLAATSSLAWFYPASGKVTIPNGDPLPYFPVNFYRWSDGMLIGYTYTNSAGIWSYSFPYCEYFVTACVGQFRRRGTTECVTNCIQCSGVTHYDDIVLECGGPKQPPCPHP